MTSPSAVPPVDALFVLLGAGAHDNPARTATLASLQEQTDATWQALTVTDALLETFGPGGRHDVTITRTDVVDHVVAAVAQTSARYVGVLADGDRLLPGAVATLAAALDTSPDAALAYADEQFGDHGLGKPRWSPERLRHHNYVGRPWLARTDAVRQVLDQVGHDSAWEHDLLLLLGETHPNVLTLRETLCVRATPDDQEPVDTDQQTDRAAAVQRHLDRSGIRATARPGPDGHTVRIDRTLSADVSVNVVIPTGWAVEDGDPARLFVVTAVRDLLAATDHADVRVTVVYDEPVPDGAFEQLRAAAGERLNLVPYRAPFNFSEKCNLGAVSDDADVIVLYNDDVVPGAIEPGSPKWLEALVAPLLETGVGVTGAKLRFPNGQIQSGGHRYYRTPETPSPVDGFRLTAADDDGEHQILLVDREVSGVTGACLAVRRDVFEAVGGLCEHLPHNYNDVDFCLKVRRAGWRILWVAASEMVHHESQSRVARVESWEHDRLRERWGGFFADDYLP